MNGRRARILALCAVPLYLAGAAWPFRLEPPRAVPNGVRLEGGTASFGEPGVLRGDGSPIVRAARQARSLDVALRVTPSSADQSGPARILEIGVDHDRADLMVGQSGDALLVRVRRPGSDDAGGPPLVARGLLAGSTVEFEVRLRDDSAALIAADGTVLDVREAASLFAAWDDDVALTLGDSPAGERSWRGDVERARVRAGDFAVDLLEHGALARPDPVWIVPARLRQVLARRLLPPFSAFDVIVNVLLFVPLGWLAARAVARNPVRIAVAFAILLSLAMETLQVAFADRVPSLVDLATNGLGAALGARLAIRSQSGAGARSRRST